MFEVNDCGPVDVPCTRLFPTESARDGQEGPLFPEDAIVVLLRYIEVIAPIITNILPRSHLPNVAASR